MEYTQALRDYLEGNFGADRLDGSDLASVIGTGVQEVSDLVALHHQTLGTLVAEGRCNGDVRGTIEAAGEFLKHTIALLDGRGSNSDTDMAKTLAQFSGTLCHEVRTPLTSVLASAGMLDEVIGPDLGDQERKLLANVLEGGERIKQRTDVLMDLVGFQSGDVGVDPQQVDTDVALKGIFQRLADQVRKAGLELRVAVDDSLPARCEVDSERMEQVLAHLARNAVRSGPKDSAVWVRAHGPGDLCIEVEDHGKGIPQNARPQFHQPFYRGTGRYAPGLGLGLSLCNEIVAAHGGRLWLESEEGKGTVVGLIIPAMSRGDYPVS